MSFLNRRFMQFLGLLTIVSASPANAQEQELLGYLNPATGNFKPYAPALPAGARSATVGVNTGTISVAMSLTNKSGVATTSTLQCSVQLSVVDTTTGSYESTSYSALATVTPSSVTCTVNTPYSVVVEPSTTRLTASLSITRLFQTSPVTSINEYNYVSIYENLPSMALPANGSTTNLTYQSVI